VRQVKSLPGQRLLFDPSEDQRREKAVAHLYVDCEQPFLFDAGHGLPGVRETGQRIIWDVE
jgi:hypothetical protein